MNERDYRLKNNFRNEKRSKSISATTTTPFSDFIDEQEPTELTPEFENSRTVNSPIETTTPLQITEEKFQITINQNQDLFSQMKPMNKKSEEVLIEHHHHLNYHPKTKLINKKNLNDLNQSAKLDNYLPNNSSINLKNHPSNYRNAKDQIKNNRYRNRIDSKAELKNN